MRPRREDKERVRRGEGIMCGGRLRRRDAQAWGRRCDEEVDGGSYLDHPIQKLARVAKTLNEVEWGAQKPKTSSPQFPSFLDKVMIETQTCLYFAS